MRAGMLPMIVIVAAFSNGAFAIAGEQRRQAPASLQRLDAASPPSHAREALRPARHLKQNAARSPVGNRDRYPGPAASDKPDRLSWPRDRAILDVPGQTTVLTRQVLDDMNATTLRDALRSTAGVTIGR
jgi:outer membrane receptor for ferric coprogen and ferric-rhodotorulic acid